MYFELKSFSCTKPSNLKSIINNKILDGELNFDLQIFLANNSIDNINNSTASNLKNNKKLKTRKNSLFFADKTDILIKNSSHTNFFKVKMATQN